MRKPDFFIVGAPKCGTTALNNYLKQHPEIFVPEKKELYYFGRDINSSSRVNTEEKYLSYFSNATNEKRIGEASVWYLYSKTAAKEIKEFCPSASIIIMLRNPVDMIYSLHSQFVYEILEDITDFRRALDAEEDRKLGRRVPDDSLTRGRHFCKELLFYREVAKYTQQIQRFLDIFGRDNVNIIVYDEFTNDTAMIYRHTLRFLGVNEKFQLDFRVVNANKRVRSMMLGKLLLRRPRITKWLGKLIAPDQRHRLYHGLKDFNTLVEPRRAMEPRLREFLQAEFASEVTQLSKLLDRDLTSWSQE